MVDPTGKPRRPAVTWSRHTGPGLLALSLTAALLLGVASGFVAPPNAALSEGGSDESAVGRSDTQGSGIQGSGTQGSVAQRQHHRTSLSGVAEVTLREGPEDSITDSFAYRMMSDQESFAWPDGANNGSLMSGIGVIAIPEIAKNLDGDRTGSSYISVTNVVSQPGYTDFVVLIADQNGLLDYVCEKLNEQQTEYVDLAVWGYVNRGFVGSVMVSATFWQHDVFGDDGVRIRNAVGLTAATASWSTFVGSHPALGWGMRGIPLDTNLGMALSPWEHDSVPACPGGWPAPPNPSASPEKSPTPTLTPTVTPTPLTAPPYAPGAPEQHMPALRWRTADDTCEAFITIQNIGAEAAKVILVGWGEPSESCEDCRGPVAVECTGLIRSDGAWRIDQAQFDGRWRSAAAYSFNTRTLADIGVDRWSSDLVADTMCEALRARLPGSCTEYETFKTAYDAGAVYAEVPLSAALGSPITGQVTRTCSSPIEDGLPIAASYPFVGGHSIGFKGRTETAYQYALPAASGAAGSKTSLAHVQNAGTGCASYELWALQMEEDSEPRRCGHGVIAAGEAAMVDLAPCLQGSGTAWIESSGPLAIAVDSSAENALSTYVGSPRQLRDMHGHPLLFGSGAVSVAPFVYSSFYSWNTTLSLQNTDSVTSVLKVSIIDRAGDELSVRQIGPLAPGSGAIVDVATMGGVPYHFVGWARVEGYSADEAPVATPWLGPEPTSTAPWTHPPPNPYEDPPVTRTPGSPEPPTVGTPQPTPTATRTRVPRPSPTPYLPHEGWCGFPLSIK